MSFRSRVSFAIIAAVTFSMLTAQSIEAGARSSFHQYEVVVTPAAAEPEDNQAKSWNPFSVAKRTAGKVAAAAVSGARKITKGIVGLFGNEDEPRPKAIPDSATETAGPTPLADQRSASVPAMAQDQLPPRAEAVRQQTAVGTDPKLDQQPQAETGPKTAAIDIAPEANESIAVTRLEKPAATKIAAKVEDNVTDPRCEKAKATISRYAFAEIEAISCKGNVYRFSAMRDGKKFSIKVSALNGDLLEVEKLEPSSAPMNDIQRMAPPDASKR